jgi:hypothetical protein
MAFLAELVVGWTGHPSITLTIYRPGVGLYNGTMIRTGSRTIQRYTRIITAKIEARPIKYIYLIVKE